MPRISFEILKASERSKGEGEHSLGDALSISRCDAPGESFCDVLSIRLFDAQTGESFCKALSISPFDAVTGHSFCDALSISLLDALTGDTVHQDARAGLAESEGDEQRVRDLMGEEAEELLRHRFEIVNVWRPIRGPLRDAPLAVCDATSVAFADFVPSDLVYRDRIGETYRVRYNPAHRWFYMPEMRSDEAVLIKCYDSAEDGTARFTAHSAFEDPTAPADVLPRESIEVRTLVFHA